MPRQAGEPARRGVAGAVHDGPAGQRARTGANADAVGVHVAFAHGVAERQRVGAAAAVIGGALRPVAEREDDRRVAGDVDDLVERHVHFDVVAYRVGVLRETWGAGVWIGADANGLDGWRHGVDAAVHQVPGVRCKPSEPARRGVARGVFDPAARQGVWVHADAVGVHFAQLHRVAELQRLGAAAGDEPCHPGRWADCQCELWDGRVCWRGGDMHHLVEGDGEANHIAAVVGVVVRRGGVGIRGDDHPAGDHPRRPRFDAMGGLRRQARVCARRGVAGGVFDGASGQRRGERPDADAVRVHVVGDHDVAEDQRVRAAAVMVGGRGGFRPNGERELRWRASQHVDHFAELDFDFDGVAEGVGLVNAGVGDDANVPHRGGHEVGAAVHAMAGLRGGQAGERTRCRIAHRVRYGAAGERAGTGGDGDAVRVQIAGDHGVGEDHRGGRCRADAGRLAARAADCKLQRRRARDDDVLVEHDLRRDGLAGAVGVAGGRTGGDRNVPDHRWRDGFHFVQRLVGEARERAVRRVAGGVLDGAAGERGRAGGNADAVRVRIAGSHGVAEGEGGGAVAGVVGGGARRRADGERDRGVAGHLHHFVERDGDLDELAGGVGAAGPGRRTHAHIGDRGPDEVACAVHLVVRALRQRVEVPAGGVAGRVGDAAAG